VITTLRQRWHRSRIHKNIPTELVNYLETRLPKKSDTLCKCEFLVVDLELTGFSIENDEIVSIGWVPVINQEILIANSKHYILKINKSVGDSATIHGIHDHHSDDGISLTEALGHLFEALQGRIIVCHCAPLDIGFLNNACLQEFSIPFIARYVDTMAIEKNRLQLRGETLASDSLRLQSCRNRYGLPNYCAHNALSDAIATAELLLAQMSHMGVSDRSRLRCLLP